MLSIIVRDAKAHAYGINREVDEPDSHAEAELLSVFIFFETLGKTENLP